MPEIEQTLQQSEAADLELKHAQGYQDQPQQSEEIEEWLDEQGWLES